MLLQQQPVESASGSHGEKMQIRMKEKRRGTSRNPTEAQIACRPFTSRGATHTANGVMRNFSAEGSYIETPCKFKLGAILHLRMVRYPTRPLPLTAEGLPRSICLAEIKWRHEIGGEKTTQYGFGLKYLD